jgi:hypothetical protein
VGGSIEGGSSGGVAGSVVDCLGRLPGEAVSGNRVGGENSGASSNIAAAGGVGGWGCEAAVDNGPVAEDGEGDEDGQVGEVGVVMCGEGDGEDVDVRGRERLVSFSPSLSNSTSHRLFAAFHVRFTSGG